MLYTNNDQTLAKQMKATRAHYIGSMRIYGEVAKYNSQEIIEDIGNNPFLNNKTRDTKSARRWSNDERVRL